MLFTTLTFFYLVFITAIVYYLPFLKRVQLPILVISSFVFYAWSFPSLLLLLLFSIFINALGSYGVAHTSNTGKQRSIATATVVVNLLLLILFKYAGLFGNAVFGNTTEIVDLLVAIPLPIGISFYTFQGISLMVDTFKEDGMLRLEKQIPVSFIKHFNNTALFIALFPQLIAGPIVKAQDFFPQIKTKYFADIQWEFIIKHLIVGYFLKMVIADNLKDFTFELAWPYFDRLSSLHLIALLFGYSMQIFADFAGYSLIAIGFSQLFGYRIPPNFQFPYIARSFSEFWRRWHISLSSFLKEYLYLPLGGNRKGNVRTYSNLFIVMALGGLWHGAAWSYMIWGVFHGLLLGLERFTNDLVSRDFLNKLGSVFLFRFFKVLFVFSLVSLAWLLFKLPDFNHVIAYFAAFKSNTLIDTDPIIVLYIFMYSSPVILYHIYYLIEQRSLGVTNKFKPAIFATLLLLIVLNSGSPQDFIYFQF